MRTCLLCRLAKKIFFWSRSLKEQIKIESNILFTKLCPKNKNSWNSSIFSKINVQEVLSCVRSPLLQVVKRLQAIIIILQTWPNLPYFREYFPPLNSFRSLMRRVFKFSLHKGEIFYILQIQKKKNSFHGNYSQKYSTLFILQLK